MKTIFFDIGGVLVFFSHEKMCEQLALLHGLKKEEVFHFFFVEQKVHAIEKGSLEAPELHSQLCAKGKKSSYADFLKAASEIFSPNPPMFSLLSRLKSQGIKLILLSNTCRPHFEYLVKHFSLFSFFDDQVLSYKVNLRKPSFAIFQLALTRTSSSPQDCFYIDDLKENIEAARKLGIASHRFTNYDKLEKALKSRQFLL